MKNIRDIKKHLHKEDYILISKITGYSEDYIKDCIYYRRNNRLIVYAASLIRNARKDESMPMQLPKQPILDPCSSIL